MATFISEYLRLDNELDELEVFDAIIDGDSNFFINLVRLKNTRVPEFEESYNRINRFFSGIATLLDSSDNKGDRFYRAALKAFDFSEINGINLGFSVSKYGSGFGRKLREQVISDAFDIVKKGSKQPEIFQLVSLFEENIGPDRLSDMVATIILPDIVNYTKRISQELQITPEFYPELYFEDGIVHNPYKNCNILLLPVDILQELPIAKCWDDIDRVITENESIRREVNEAVSEEWAKWASGRKKRYLKEHIFKEPEKCARVIEAYRHSTIPKIELSSDLDYFAAALFRQMKKSNIIFQTENPKTINSLQATEEIINIFKDWVENNRGWSTIQDTDSGKREKAVQRLVHLGAKHYISSNNLDMSFEPNAGRGPADFKISRGGDATVCELKLSSNGQYLHGYTIQIEEYAAAENTNQKFYIFVDVGNPVRLKKIIEKHQARITSGEDVPILFVIDSTPKMSASIQN